MRSVMEATKLNTIMKTVEDALAAVTFAEEGQAATARSIMKDGRRVLLALKEDRMSQTADHRLYEQ